MSRKRILTNNFQKHPQNTLGQLQEKNSVQLPQSRDKTAFMALTTHKVAPAISINITHSAMRCTTSARVFARMQIRATRGIPVGKRKKKKRRIPRKEEHDGLAR